MTSDNFDIDVFLGEFVTECSEATELAVQDVLNLEDGKDQDSIDRIFRALHSIKGNASMFGLYALSEFVHKVEDTCTDIRSGKRVIDKLAIDVLLKSFDMIENAFEHITEKGSDKIDYSIGYAFLNKFDKPSSSAGQETATEYEFSTPNISGSEIESKTILSTIEELKDSDFEEDKPISRIKNISAELGVDVEFEGIQRVVQDDLSQYNYMTQSTAIAGCADFDEQSCICQTRKNPTALVVDDDFATRKIIVSFLSKYMPCYIAKDGVEAIQAVTESLAGQSPYFDLIIMDIMMPNIDGLQACKAIRQIEQSKNVKSFSCESKIFIASTISDDKTMLKAVYECGADTYIVKPVVFEDIRRQLVRYRLIEPQ
ncbi:response regulator [Maridesulfovibrio zosterae]|uniref:ATP-binding response regulator n=1 Tax=Maridesulfovibrio zosterae TaxID=82171 RepID=UPI000409332B|nr:response regulator [Maridesulfovibrio zosterae]